MTHSPIAQLDHVFVLIPVHNRKATTLACLTKLQQTGDLDRFTVVVIDDGSTDGTGPAIAAQFPQVVVLPGDGNLWWTGAMRRGMEYAMGQGARYCLWLNDDCYPDEGTLLQLIQFMAAHPKAIAAPVCRLASSGTLLENGCRQRQRLTAQPGEVVEVESVTGYCVGIPRNVCEAIGYPDDRHFPHYSGDDMYTLKACRHGFKVCLVGDASVRLKGMVEGEHTFTSYLQARFPNAPSLQRVFLDKKSRYYLPTQFFYHLYKYRLLKGSLYFTAKLMIWLWQYGHIRLIDQSFKIRRPTA